MPRDWLGLMRAEAELSKKSAKPHYCCQASEFWLIHPKRFTALTYHLELVSSVVEGWS